MALTTDSRVKSWLRLSGTAEDAWVTQARGAAEAAFLKLIDRQLEATDYVDFYSGLNSPILVLREYPVLSVTEVRLDVLGNWGAPAGSFGAASVLVEGTDWSRVKDGRNGASEFGRIQKIGGVWPGRWEYRAGLLTPMMRPSAGTIKVTYRAGMEVIPADVELAIWQTVALLKSSRVTGLIPGEEHFEDYGFSALLEDAIAALSRPGSLASIVARYKRRSPRYDVLG